MQWWRLNWFVFVAPAFNLFVLPVSLSGFFLEWGFDNLNAQLTWCYYGHIIVTGAGYGFSLCELYKNASVQREILLLKSTAGTYSFCNTLSIDLI